MVFTNKKTILIVAGEESGDLHGSSLVGEMVQRMPELSFFGIGGDRLQDGGVETIEHTDNMAVMGFSEVVSKYRFLRKVFQNIVKEIDRRNPERAILIDYPGFNLRLAKKLKERGVPVTYFISPQVWAWKEKRVEVIRKCVDQLICIFPFEEAWYAKRGVDATFVGHPFMDMPEPEISREEFLQQHKFDPDRTTIALMPGSRQQEVNRHLSVMVKSLFNLRQRGMNLQAVIGKAPGVNIRGVNYHGLSVEEANPQLALRFADGAVVASGTISFEAALYNTPSVVIYKLSPFTWFFAKRIAKVKHVSMPNLIAGRELFPELLQEKATPELVAANLQPLLADEEKQDEIYSGMAEVQNAMGEPGAAKRAAKLILQKLE